MSQRITCANSITCIWGELNLLGKVVLGWWMIPLVLPLAMLMDLCLRRNRP